MTSPVDAVKAVVDALKPLQSDERHRTVQAALLLLGENLTEQTNHAAGGATKTQDDGDEQGAEGSYTQTARKWMKQHGVSADELDQVFEFNEDGTFHIHDVPGKSKRERTLNAYTLTGLGTYLQTNNKAFTDAAARSVCGEIGCYDANNHATFLGGKRPEFGGTKKKGYTLTPAGMKRGADLVKQPNNTQ